MSKLVEISNKLVRVPTKIFVDGKEYPITRHNIEVVKEYWETLDEAALDKLKDFALVF